VHFWLMFIFFNSTFLPLLCSGSRVCPGRATYEPSLQGLNDWGVDPALWLLDVYFLYNVVYSLIFVRKPARPTVALEVDRVAAADAIPVNNFEQIPVFDSEPTTTHAAATRRRRWRAAGTAGA